MGAPQLELLEYRSISYSVWAFIISLPRGWHLANTPAMFHEEPRIRATNLNSPHPSTEQEKVPHGDVKHHEGGIWVFTWSEIVNGVLQTFALIITIVFGVWAIKSYNAAVEYAATRNSDS
jgi:hypothetical protein